MCKGNTEDAISAPCSSVRIMFTVAPKPRLSYPENKTTLEREILKPLYVPGTSHRLFAGERVCP